MKHIGISATLISVLTLFLNFQTAFASTVESELRLPWDELNKELPLQKVQFEWGETELQFQDLPFLFKNIRLEIQSQAQELLHFNTQPFQSQLKVSGMQMALSTGPLQIRKNIIREINGAQVTVKLNAECAPISMQQQNIQVATKLEWEVSDHNVSSRITTFDVIWPISGWHVSEISCQGPAGFADLIQIELQKQLTHPELFFPFLQEKMQSVMNSKLEELTKNILNVKLKFLQDRVQAEVQRIKSVNFHGITLGVVLRLQDQDQQFYILKKSSDSVSSKVGLTISTSGLEKLLQVSTRGQSFQSTDQQMSGFKQLMRSRFLQFFLWPDLMNFSKRAKFNFIHKLNENTKISLLPRGKMKLSLQGDSWLQGERDGKMWNYVFFRSQLNTQSQLTIAQSKLKVNLDSNNVRLKKQFGSDYKSKYQPSERISTSMIQTAIEETYLNNSLSWDLPSFEIRSGLNLKIDSMKTDADSNYIFEFQRP